MSQNPAGGPDREFADLPIPTARPNRAGSSGQPAPEGAELLYHILVCIEGGNTKTEVRKQMIGMGYSATDSTQWVEEIAEWRRINPAACAMFLDAPGIDTGASHQHGFAATLEPVPVTINTNMWVGGGICLLGTVITLLSCYAAAEGTGGRYFIAWGAMFFGAAQFFRGLTQYNLAREAVRSGKSPGG